ncbi:chitin elicitor receptor kinase 1 [Physcomitrium patens]|uniref:Uncharacterized protein n=1 Tax=Physcomitrium patens TaxID=3218 RepID=A0A7I4A954_PHYPA|nr:chitin elicitor receptor kinase 1 [Physcomitrium patens]XP_024388365.1 chitin elicitor receptor kinase 1 [Physcomitrium patens]XP_024388366.1 chitin elicitor receptor kinase 1 [Physcomitrium patens]|eukprot:XP_024388364.1 chitin elicitor receptor kinase 1 [Physcomitrella patens]
MKFQMKMKSELCRTYKYWLILLVLWLSGVTQRETGVLIVDADCIPPNGCKALAYYRLKQGDDLEKLQGRFQTNNSEVLAYNPQLVDANSIQAGTNIYLPFDCLCLNGELVHRFSYTVTTNDTAEKVVDVTYQKLTTVGAVRSASNSGDLSSIYSGQSLTIPVRCYCGDPNVDPKYGLFSTYVVQADDQLTSLSTNFSVDADVISKFNSDTRNLSPDSIIFIPSKAANGSFPPFSGSSGGGSSRSNVGIIVGVVVGGIVLAVLLLFALIFGFKHFRRRKLAKEPTMQQSGLLSSSSMAGSKPSRSGSTMLPVPKSVEFTYEELAAATDNFSLAKKIGQGGFASVYYGVIRDQKLAIKKMTLQCTKEFLAELQVLTNVHHTNLVQLIGYCTTNSLFLVYEYIENGTLDHHLRRRKSDDKPPLSWLQRVQICLDSARGLEYIHEHTKPTYIHRDIKSANILLDDNFRAKVADFGLAKLAEEGTGTGIVGTFGYMPPEYALYGEVSPKLDVYAFGVVLFEIISGRVAISSALPSENDQQSPAQNRESRTLTSFFEPVLNDPDGKTLLPKCIDPALNGEYSLDAVWKMAQLARRCTHQSPDMRPTMRFAVVQLMTLASVTQEWDVGYFSRASSQSQPPSGNDQL